MINKQTRRQFIRDAGYLTLGVALLGCGSESSGGRSEDGDDGDGGNIGANSEAPIWSRIPTQSWIVGVPVHIDLMDYVADPDDDTLIILLDKTLPEGVTLNGSVISGTPIATVASTTYIATADDGNS